MIARAFPYDRPCRFQKFEATETILATGTTIWKPGLSVLEMSAGVRASEMTGNSFYSNPISTGPRKLLV